ncbi:MAG: trehalose-6-phosphate synthase, partial [Pseudomonadota bacterium]|nr:trehalose-6-phosphate synthase [Pseudomonadota bacterium]
AERWRRGFLEAVEADVPETNLRSGEIVEYRGRQVQVMTMPLGYSQRAIARPAAELAPEIARWAENHPLIVTYGRSDPIKGAQRAVCAFSLARTSGSGAELSRLLVRVSPNHLNVSANARYMESLQREIARTNEAAREEVVRLVVESSSTATLAAYRRADVLLVPSAVDGQNLAAFEGVMVNRRHAPLILSDHCGASELLAQGAITINPFDIVEIAGAIVRALTEERGHREVRAAQCRQLAAPYTVERWIDAQLVALGLERHTDRLVHSMDASKPKSYSQ